MINHFSTLQANTESIRQLIIDGQEWSSMTTTRWDDMYGQAGGNSRAQFVSIPHMIDDHSYSFGFDLMFPEDWDFSDETYVAVHDIHTNQADPSGEPFDLFVVGKRLKAVLKNQAGTTIDAEFWMDIIPNHPYRFRNFLHVGSDYSGYYKVDVNGCEWFNHPLKTLWDGEDPTKGPYWKVGPYCANWDDVDFRRLLVRI